MLWATAVVVAGLLQGAPPAPEFLSVRGDLIFNEHRPVPLRGINIGSWLMMETWIPGMGISWEAHLARLAEETGITSELEAALKATGRFDDDTMTIQGYFEGIKANLAKSAPADKAGAFWRKVEAEPPITDAATLDRVWRQRFGDDGARDLWDAFHDTWIAEEDFRRAKDLGFNFIRIPFWYRWFEDDDKPYEYKDYGFRYLDRAIGWARAHGLYVMLDLHGAVGGQSPWDHTGELSRGELFRNEEFQKRTRALWKAIADRYKDEPAVCAYGCLNEPYSARDLDDWVRVHDGIYDAIRSVDTRHIIMMEDGYKLENPPYREEGFFPRPQDMGWENVMYSFHFYHTGSYSSHKKNLKQILKVGQREEDRCDVPLYLGEFNAINDDRGSVKAMALYGRAFNKEGWNWSPWTLKYTGNSPEKTLWGVYQFNGEYQVPDIHRDSKEELLRKIGQLRAENYTLHKAYAQALRKALPGGHARALPNYKGG